MQAEIAKTQEKNNAKVESRDARLAERDQQILQTKNKKVRQVGSSDPGGESSAGKKD